MVKLNVKRKLGRTVIDIGIQEIEDVNFARQLIEKGLATLVEGEIPEREVRKKVIKKVPKKKKKG
jgi:ribosomal protein S3